MKNLLPSLLEIAIIRVAIILWNRINVPEHEKTFSTYDPESLQMRMEWEVLIEWKKFVIPKEIRNCLAFFVRPVGAEITKWRNHNKKYFDIAFVNRTMSQLFWSVHGRINYVETAESIANDETINTIKRYRMACLYCLEPMIRKLWDKIPSFAHIDFYWEHDITMVNQNELVVLWTYDIKGEIKKFISKVNNRENLEEMEDQGRILSRIYQFVFEYSSIEGNKVASDYFLRKLSDADKELTLVDTAKKVSEKYKDPIYGDVLFGLYLAMNKHQQEELLRTYAYEILSYVLNWPWQHLFVEILDQGGLMLRNKEVVKLLTKIIRYDENLGYEVATHQKFFKVLWEQSPDEPKEYINNNYIEGFWIELFKTENVELFNLVVKHAQIIPEEDILELYHLLGKALNMVKDVKKISLVEQFVICKSSAKSARTFKMTLESLIKCPDQSIKIFTFERRILH